MKSLNSLFKTGVRSVGINFYIIKFKTHIFKATTNCSFKMNLLNTPIQIGQFAHCPLIIEIFISVKSKQTRDHISQMRLSSNAQKNNGICLFKMITSNSGRLHLFHFIRSFRLSSVSTNTQIAFPSQVNSPGHFNKRQISILKKCVFDISEGNYYII